MKDTFNNKVDKMTRLIDISQALSLTTPTPAKRVCEQSGHSDRDGT